MIGGDSVFLLIVITLFLTGFLGDICTQVAARFSDTAELFRDYWNDYGKIGGALNAGLITLVFGGLLMLLCLFLYKHVFHLKTRSTSFVFFCASIGFVGGVVIDILANRGDWIPGLRRWYTTVGDTKASLWSGGLSFAFVLGITGIVYAQTQR